jgi:hypothetical protein
VPRLLAAWFGLALAAAGVAASITALSVALRDVMRENGGFCASGGPYEIAQECSRGTVFLLFGSVLTLLVFMGLHAAFTAWVDGPVIGWPAFTGVLFAVLGWNFVQYGLDPPPPDDGIVYAWLLTGAVFFVMAIGFAAPATMRAVEWLRRGDEPEPPLFPRATVMAAVNQPDAEPEQ